MLLTSSNDIAVLAAAITNNSELFGDECISVEAHLVELWHDTVTFGYDFTRQIPTMWGSSVTVNSVCPTICRKHSWSF